MTPADIRALTDAELQSWIERYESLEAVIHEAVQYRDRARNMVIWMYVALILVIVVTAWQVFA